MAIDSSALTSINNAIASYTKQDNNDYKKQLQSNQSSLVNRVSTAATDALTYTRHRVAFEEKMKIANEADDTVSISKESLKKLQDYNKSGVASDDKKASSSSSGYTYDYQAIKKKNLENQKAFEADVAKRYGKKSDAVNSDKTDTTVNKDATANKDANVKTDAVKDTVAKVDSTQKSDTTTKTDTTKTESSATETKKTQYSYDYNSMKAKDAQNAAKIEQEVKAQFKGQNSPDSIVS